MSGDSVVQWVECGPPGKWMKPLECDFLRALMCSVLHCGSTPLFRFSILPNPNAEEPLAGMRLSIPFRVIWGSKKQFRRLLCFVKISSILRIYGAQIKDSKRMQVCLEHWGVVWECLFLSPQLTNTLVVGDVLWGLLLWSMGSLTF